MSTLFDSVFDAPDFPVQVIGPGTDRLRDFNAPVYDEILAGETHGVPVIEFDTFDE